jgi:hypothetical protein
MTISAAQATAIPNVTRITLRFIKLSSNTKWT